MRLLPVSLLSDVRGLIRRAAPSSRLYAIPALAWTNPTVSHSEQLNAEEGNFDCNALELNEIGVLRVLSSMRDDPYLALSFLKRIERNGVLPSVQAYATVIRIVCSWGLDKKLDPLVMELIRKGDDERGFSVMDLLQAVGEVEEDGKRALLLLTRLSSVLVKAYANLKMLEDAIDIFFQTCCLGCAPDIKALNFLMNRLIASGKNDMVVDIFWEVDRRGLGADAHTYVLVFQALIRNRDLQGVEKFLNKLLSSETTSPCEFYLTFIEGLCLIQMADEAHFLLQKMMDANILVENSHLAIAYRKVIRGLCSEMKINAAESVALEMEGRGIDSDVYVYSAIIEGHRKNMNIPKALDVFDKMVDKGIRINCVIVSSILQCYCQLGMFSEACGRFKMFRDSNISLDRVCYNVAFGALGKLGKVEEAIELFREMTGEGIAPDVINYTTLIGDCCRHGKILEALDLMNEMEGTGITPDIATYNVLAGGLARNGLAEEADNTLKLMEARGVKPTSVTHSMVIEGLVVAENDASIVKGYCEAGCLDQAFERFSRLDFPLPKNMYFKLFTSLCTQKDYIGRAQDLLYRMWELGVEPEKSMYGKLIGAWCGVDNVRDAHQFYKLLVSKEIIPDLFTYTTMINTYCRLNYRKEALVLFEDMKRRGIKPDVVTYTVLLDKIPELDMKREMEADDVKPDIVYCTVLINTCLRFNKVKEAFTLFNNMKRSENKPDVVTYTVLVNTYLRFNKVKKAYTLLTDMKMSGIKPDVVTYTVFLNNNPELDLKKEMKSFDVKPDVFYYTVLINQQCKIGDLKEAERIFVEMIEREVEPNAAPYTALIAGCCKIGNLREAKRIFYHMIKKGLKPDVATARRVGCYRNGSAEERIKPTKVSRVVVHYPKLEAKRLPP